LVSFDFGLTTVSSCFLIEDRTCFATQASDGILQLKRRLLRVSDKPAKLRHRQTLCFKHCFKHILSSNLHLRVLKRTDT
jgi:hypothetical protein